MFKNFFAAFMLLAVLVTSASAASNFGLTPVVSTVTIRPEVVDSMSVELWNDLGQRILVYRGTTLPIIPRDPHLLLKIVVAPFSTEGDLSKDSSLGNGRDAVHLNVMEFAVLINGKGVRVQDLKKNPYEAVWRTADLDSTIFLSTQSKVKGGYSHTGAMDVASIHRNTPEGKGGSYADAFYVENYRGQKFCGDCDQDYNSVAEFQEHVAPRFGIQVQSRTVETTRQAVATVAPVDSFPLQIVHVDYVNGKTTMTFLKKGVHVKVITTDGSTFVARSTYHGVKTVSNDGHTYECIHDNDEPLTFNKHRHVQVIVNDQLLGSYGE